MSKFIELHKYKSGKPIIINIDCIRSIYDYEDRTVIWNDKDYIEVQETYADIWLLLEPIRVKKPIQKIEMKTQDANVKKLIEYLLNSVGQFNELRPITTDSEKGNISVN